MEQSKKFDLRFGILAIIILLAAATRAVPVISNFSPLAAIGLFGAAHFSKKWQAFFIPLAATWLSDLLLNNTIYAGSSTGFTWFYEGFYWQYGTYLLITLMGIFLLKKVTVPRVIGGALLSTVIFFLVTNFGTWASGTMYPKTIEGLMACYAAGLPFIKGTLISDLVFSGVLFGGFALAQKQWNALKPTLA